VDATRAGEADADPADKQRPRPRQPTRHAAFGDAELPGRFPAGHALKVAQDDDAPVVVGQAAQLLVHHPLQIGVMDFWHGRFGHVHHLRLTPPPLRRSRPQSHRRLPGHAVEPVGDGLSRHVRCLADEDEKRGLKRILGVVVVQEAAADAPHHPGVLPHQSGKGVLVPASHEAAQEFAIGQTAATRPEIGQKVLDDPVQRAGRHRLQVPVHRRLYFIILAVGGFDPPVWRLPAK
jgi:hypothetical protein